MLNEMINPYGYSLGDPVGIACPVCGRIHNHPREGYWCPYCGTSVSSQMREELHLLKDRMLIIEKLLEWHMIPNEFIDLDELSSEEELNGEG